MLTQCHGLLLQSRIVLLFCFLMMLDIVVQINGAEVEGDGIEGNLFKIRC